MYWSATRRVPQTARDSTSSTQRTTKGRRSCRFLRTRKMREVCAAGELERQGQAQQGEEEELRRIEEVLVVAQDVEEEKQHGEKKEENGRPARETGQSV